VCVEIHHAIAVLREDGHLAIVQVHHVARVLENRRHVAGDVVLAFTQSDEQRTSLARRDDLLGIVGRDHRDAVGALHEGEGVDHRLFEIAVEGCLDEMREDFGVRLRDERVPRLLEHRAQRSIVLDDAVVHHRDGALAVVVWMRVEFVRRPVRRPARMRDADVPLDGIRHDRRFEHGDLALGLPRLHAVSVHQRHARGIVAAVLEALEPVHKKRRRVLAPHVTNNSAHVAIPVE